MNLNALADQENIILEQLLTQSAMWWKQDVNGDNYLKIFHHGKPCIVVIRVWKKSGIWQEIHDLLVKKIRKIIGKNGTPTVGIIEGGQRIWCGQENKG